MSRFVALMDQDTAVEPPSLENLDITDDVDQGAAPTTDDIAAPLTDPIFWVDLEMSGLDVQEHTILELAVIVTDGVLERSIEGPALTIHHDEGVLSSMNDWSQKQHAASGLTQRCRESTTSMEAAEAALVDFVVQHARGRPAVLGGACVYVDKGFLDARFPLLAPHLSHRVIDVSSIRELAWRWHPSAARGAPKGESTHRALDDIRYSIAELRYYREACWRPLEKRGRGHATRRHERAARKR